MSDGGRDRASIGLNVWKSSQKWSVRRSAVRSIAWLDGSRGCSLLCDITRIIGRDIKTRSIVEGMKLIFAVIALRKVEGARIAGMQRSISWTARTAQSTATTAVAATTEYRIEKYRQRDAYQHAEDPAQCRCNEQIWREENQNPFRKTL